MKIDWSLDTRQHTCGSTGNIGRVHLFTIGWDGISGTKHAEGPWILYCKLPGIKSELGNFLTEDDAKLKAEKVITHWLKMIGVEQK